jgi:hypothetical protein
MYLTFSSVAGLGGTKKFLLANDGLDIYGNIDNCAPEVPAWLNVVQERGADLEFYRGPTLELI